MATISKNGVREFRIANKILAAAEEGEEAALAWYYHLEETLRVPFAARAITLYPNSPLAEGEAVIVTGLAEEAACRDEIKVTAEHKGQTIVVPLAQLEPVEVDEATREAVEDWHYWVARGYEF